MVNLYVIETEKYGREFLINNSTISCEEFKNLCKLIGETYGNDMYIIYDRLIKSYGFKRADLQCVYSVDILDLIE